MSNLEAMSDTALAEWHAGWMSGTANNILAEREWKRRHSLAVMHEQFKLDEKLAAQNAEAMRFAAVLSVCATLAGAILGAVVTYLITT